MRFEDTPELFGRGCGTSTCGDIECDVCGQPYNQGNDTKQSYDGDSVTHTTFAGLTVCDCCFEEIESEVLRRMPDILSWYRRILAARRQRLDRDDAAMQKIDEQLSILRDNADRQQHDIQDFVTETKPKPSDVNNKGTQP